MRHHRTTEHRIQLSAVARAALAGLGVALVLPLAGCLLDITPGSGSTAGGNTGGGGGGTGTGTTVEGLVVKGPVSGSTVTAYELKADGSLGDALGSTTSGADGSYKLTVRTGYTGAVAILAAGGTYVSEADGTTVTKTSDLLAVIPSLAGGNAAGVAVTPLTDMVAARARLLMGGGKAISDALGDAYTLVGSTYGVPAASIATLVPTFDKPSLGSTEFTSGVVLGALDACDKLLPAGARGSLFRAISDDLSDGVFDGKKNGVPITISGGSLMSRTAGTSDFLACISSYTTTGKAVTDAGITPTEIAPTVSTVRTSITNSTATQGTGLSTGSSGAISSLAYGGKQWLFLAARAQGVVAVDISDPTATAPTVKVYSALAAKFGGSVGGVVPLVGADHPQLLVFSYGTKHIALVDADTGAVDYEADLPLVGGIVGFSGGSAYISGAIPDTGRDGVWLSTTDGYIFFDRATRTLGTKYTYSSPASLAENVGGDISHNILFAANYAPGVQLVDLVAGASYYFDSTAFSTVFPNVTSPDGGAVDASYQVGIVTAEDRPTIGLINLKTVVRTDVAGGRNTFVPAAGGAVALSLGTPTISGSAVDSDTHLALFMAGFSSDVAVGLIEDPASVPSGGTWKGLSDWRYTINLTGYAYARDPHAVAVVKNLSNLKAYGYLLDGGVHKTFQIDMADFLAAPAVGTGANAKQLTTDPTTTGIVKTYTW